MNLQKQSYTTFNGWYDVPSTPNSPYSDTRYSQYNMPYFKTPIIPPGFTALGALGVGGLFGGMPGDVYRYTFGFEVASSQKSLTLNFKNLSTLCYESQTSEASGDRFPILSYPLDNLADYKLPTDIDYQELGSQSIIVPNKGTFEYKGYTEQSGYYLLNFLFTNASAGYNVNGSFTAYLVGDDSLFRSPDSKGASTECSFYGSYNAGPAQTVTLCPIPFKIPSGVHDLKFIFYDNDYYTNRAFAAYSFVPSPLSQSAIDINQDKLMQTIKTIKSYKATGTGQDITPQGQILPYEADIENMIGKMHVIKRYENGDVVEEIWDNSDLCSRTNNSQWECQSGKTLVGDFNAFMVNVVEGKPTWFGPTVTQHGSRLESYEGRACSLYFSEELFNGNGFQTSRRYEICFDIDTYLPVHQLIVYKNIVNDVLTATTRSEQQIYDVNVPVEITLPTP